MTGEIFTLSNDGTDHLILQFQSRRKDCVMSFLSPSQVRLLQFWSLEAGQHLGLELVPAAQNVHEGRSPHLRLRHRGGTGRSNC